MFRVMERMGFSMGVIQREWVGMRELGAMIRAGMAVITRGGGRWKQRVTAR